jgi:hypothetical protein
MENKNSNDSFSSSKEQHEILITSGKDKSNEIISTSNVNPNTSSNLNYDYDTDYHVDLLVDEKKMKNYNNGSNFSSKLTDKVPFYNVNYQVKLKKMEMFLRKCGINKFNLEKYVITNDKFKILINGKSNSGKHTIVNKIIKFLYTFESLPQNIIIFTNSKQFANKIKNICIGNAVYCYNTKALNNIHFLSKKIISNSLIVSDTSLNIETILNSDSKIIVLNNHYWKCNYKLFNIVLNYLELGSKNEYNKYISNEVYYTLLKKYNNRCFFVIQQNKKLEWYALNTHISCQNSENISSVKSYKKNNNSNKTTVLSDLNESTISSDLNETSISTDSDETTISTDSDETSISTDSDETTISTDTNNKSSYDETNSESEIETLKLSDCSECDIINKKNLSYIDNITKLTKRSNVKKIKSNKYKEITGSLSTSSSLSDSSFLTNDTSLTKSNKKSNNKVVKLNIGKDIKLKIYY